VARPTRQQRRARREQRGVSVAESARARQAQTRPGQVQKLQAGQGVRERSRYVPFRGLWGFVRESSAELKKVEWPRRAQVMQGTIVVILACAIVGGYLAVADVVFKRLVQKVLLGQ
jgi:preprotein translocase subunit SecE